VRLVTFDGGFGRVEGDAVVPMGADLVEYLRTGEATDGDPLALAGLRLRAPIPKPGKIVAIGLNYRDHAAEAGQPIPDEPILFAKFANSVIGPGEAIEVPRATDRADYEAELGVVIGRVAREISCDEALSVVAGYTCVNDVSARDLQLRVSQWTRGKAIDTFLPMGPCLATPEAIPDPGRLAIRCVLNGDVMQDSNTDQMIFGVAELVSFISQTITLEPGDVIATGTPPGVGFTRNPPRLLGEGDEVTIEIEGIGALTNPVRLRT
jgi:2,4-diketo-3-deoxy-L-fuconate hydrolase